MNVFMNMASTTPALPMKEENAEITAAILRERSRLGNFVRAQVRNAAEAEDIVQDVFRQFVEAYRLPAPIEQASAWLWRVARNRIVDRFRKKKEEAIGDRVEEDDAGELRLDLALPDPSGGPEAAYARSALLESLQQAIDELPAEQRDVFLAHELEGLSFKAMAARDGIPINTLLARKRYAVLYLRARLQATYDDFQF